MLSSIENAIDHDMNYVSVEYQNMRFGTLHLIILEVFVEHPNEVEEDVTLHEGLGDLVGRGPGFCRHGRTKPFQAPVEDFRCLKTHERCCSSRRGKCRDLLLVGALTPTSRWCCGLSQR